MIVENRSGAGGTLASSVVLQSQPDGYTMLFVSSAHAVNPALYAKLPYDTLKDFSGVALVASSPSVIVVKPGLKIKSVKELVAYGKANPGKLNYGSAGIGSATHLVGEYFKGQAGIDMLHIPYKGVQEAVSEVMAGRIDVAFPPIALASAQMKAGNVVAVGLTAPERSPAIPDVPTVAESAIPGFDYTIWYALVASSSVPRPIVEQLAREVSAVSQLPEIRDKLVQQGLLPRNVLLREFDQYIAAEMEKLGKIVKASGAKAE